MGFNRGRKKASISDDAEDGSLGALDLEILTTWHLLALFRGLSRRLNKNNNNTPACLTDFHLASKVACHQLLYHGPLLF